MQEDVKVIIEADISRADKEIDKLENKKIEIKTDVKVSKNPLKEVTEEVNIIGKRVNEIKLNRKAFSPDDIKLLKAEIEAAALKAKSIYFGEGNKSAKELAERLKEMHKELGAGKKEVEETNKAFGNMDVMIGNLKAKIIANIVNTLKQGVKEGAQLAKQLEFATEKIKTISSENRGTLNSEIDKIGKKYGVDYREVSEGLYQVVTSIGDVAKKYELLDTANKLALTGFSSVNEAVDGLTTVLNAYNLGIEEAERVSNIFVRTQKVGKLTVQEFQQQLYKTVPVAKELGIQVDEIGASIALLTVKGSKAEVAQTQMGAFMYELLDIGSDISKLFNQVAGQSINSFVSGGGNLEGILRTLKGYSNTNNFNIESLLGRKEAKSFWLNIGNDIDGYIEKLNAINDPMDALTRNTDNMMATMEKRIDRGARYWDSFKKNIGEVALELIASTGDIASGYDEETTARKKLNIEMEESLRTLEELSKKQSLSEEEQKKLNDSLRTLEILAPEIAAAYKKWSVEGGNYANVLSLIKQRQDEVNKTFKELSYEETKKEKEDLEREIKRMEEKNISTFGSGDLGFGEVKTPTLKELSNNRQGADMEYLKMHDKGKFAKIVEEIQDLENKKEQLKEKNKKLEDKEKELKNWIENKDKPENKRTLAERRKEVEDKKARFEVGYSKRSEDVKLTSPLSADKEFQGILDELKQIKKEEDTEKLRYQNEIEKWKEIKANTVSTDIQKDADREIEALNKKINTFGSENINVDNTDYKKIKEEIKGAAKKEIAELNLQYEKDIEKIANLSLTARNDAYKKIEDEHNKKLGKIQDKKDIDLRETEIKRLQANIKNAGEDEKTLVTKQIELMQGEISDIQVKRKKTDFDNETKRLEEQEKEKKKSSDKIKTELDKKLKAEQLKIDTEYNNKMLSITEEYNKSMANLKEKGTKEEIEAVRKTYDKAKKDIDTEKKIGTLKNKLDNTHYATTEEKKLNTATLKSEIDLTVMNSEREKLDKEIKEAQDKNTKALEIMSNNLKNLANMFQTIGDNTNSTAVKNISNIASIGGTVFDALKGTEQGSDLLTKIFGSGSIPGFKNFTMGAGIGGAITGALGGGAEGNIGSMIGSGIGTVVGGPVGSIVGGALGSVGGSLFGSKSKKKKKREEKRRKAAQERLQKGLISGQYKWADVLDEYNEDLARLGTGNYINLYDKVSANTSYDNVLSNLEGAKIGEDGVSMSALKQLMPQYNEQQLVDWFKSLTGGAVLNGDTLSTGEGKYGAIDISALAQQVTNANRELEKSLKETIKNIIDFSADSLASVVRNGFGDGLEDLGDNIEKMLANSLKSAFLNTEISKALFKGLSDKVSDMVKDMFKEDANLGINLETGDLQSLTFTQYIDLIKKYMETSNDKLEDLFKELGMNMDNLNNSMDVLNKNMSKNTVQGMATNLWKHNTGQKVITEFNGTFEIPVILNGQTLDKHIIKVTNDSLRKARRNRF